MTPQFQHFIRASGSGTLSGLLAATEAAGGAGGAGAAGAGAEAVEASGRGRFLDGEDFRLLLARARSFAALPQHGSSPV